MCRVAPYVVSVEGDATCVGLLPMWSVLRETPHV